MSKAVRGRNKSRSNSATSIAQSRFLRFGGHPILDFCNTQIAHGDRIEERLESRSELSLFIKEVYSDEVPSTDKELLELMKLRSLLRGEFLHLISPDSNQSCLAELNEWLGNHPLRLSLFEGAKEHMLIAKLESPKPAHHVTAILLQSLLDFTKAVPRERLKKCANQNCSHLFFDTSKNNTRSWCSMKSCGNIMKARAFYRRKSKS